MITKSEAKSEEYMSSEREEGEEGDRMRRKREYEEIREENGEESDRKKPKYEEVEDDEYGPSPGVPIEKGRGEDGERERKGEWDKVRRAAEETPIAAVDELLSRSDRADWMTMLPSEKRGEVKLDYDKMQQSVTGFSKRGRESRGDTSSWTDTPADRAARESGDARMSSLDMAKKMAAQRFQKEADSEARASSASSRALLPSLYEQVKLGTISKPSKSSQHSPSDSDSSSSSPRHKSSHKHKKSKEKRDKHKSKDKKSKDKHKQKRSHSSRDDPQLPRALSTAHSNHSSTDYWDRERDLVQFGNRDSEKTRQQVFREASLLNSRFHSTGSSSSSHLR